MYLYIIACTFKRTALSNEEPGIIINEEGPIIDAKGEVVEKVYEWRAEPLVTTIRLDMRNF